MTNPLQPIREPRNNGQIRRAKKKQAKLKRASEATMRRFIAGRVRAKQR